MTKQIITILMLSSLITSCSINLYHCTSLTADNLSNNVSSKEITPYFEKFYDGLLLLSPPRTEYESSKQYNDRMMEVKSRSILNTYNVTDTFAVYHKIDSSSIEYDADSRLIKLKNLLGNGRSPFKSISSNDDKSSRVSYDDAVKENTMSFDMSYESVDKGTYKASNAYGATTDVLMSESISYSLVMMNIQSEYGCEFNELSLTATPDEARSIKNNIYLKIIFIIRSPYTACKSGHFKPTMSHPWSNDYTNYYIVGRVLRVQLYSRGKLIQSYIPD